MTPLPFALSVSPWLTSHWCRLALVVLGMALVVLAIFMRKRHVPVVVALGVRKLNRHELRPWLAMGLRVLGVSVLAFALAEPYFDQSSRAMTVLFVLDRSQSIPEDLEDDKEHGRVDRRSQRVLQ